MTRLEILAVGAIGCAGVLLSGRAEAHFMLQSPPNWMSQTGDGSPQKTAPCGNEGGGTATNTVTAYRPGQTIMVSISETVAHPGWYKAVLSTNGQAGLPADPTPRPGTTYACGDVAADGGISSLTIQNPPVFPVLVDGALYHTSAQGGTRMFPVTLPSNVTCTNCTLQIVEFMAMHGAPCFYHHCANITIQGAPADGGTTTTGGGGAGGRADAGADAATTGGAGASGSTGGGGGITGTSGAGGTSAAGSGGSGGTTGTTGAGGASASGTGGTTASGQGGNGNGGASGTGTGGSAGGGKSDGGGCAIAASGASWAGAAAIALAFLLARRRRR